MAGSQTKITLTHDQETTGDLQLKMITERMSKTSRATALQNWLARISSALSNAKISATIDDGNGVAATATITFTGANTTSDTVLINGVTMTSVASGPANNQWADGSSASTAAANLAAAINASTTSLISGQVSAAAAGAVVTITSLFPGLAGNAVTVAKGTDAGAVMTVSGARLTGGTAPTNPVSYSDSFGL